MKTPNFLCVGAQKAGTTTLHDILKHHPDIYLPKSKEATFFSKEKEYAKGTEWWLNEYFSTYADEPIMGNISPDYLYFEDSASRISEALGTDFKLIIIVRHPVDRAYSHYLMTKRRGLESLSFSEAIEVEHERILIDEEAKNNFSYLTRSHYIEQINRYLKYFKRENILFLSFENDIRNNIDKTMETIQTFLDVNYVKLNTQIKSNAASEMRSPKFQQTLIKQSPVKTIFKKIVGQKSRRWIKEKLANMNQKKLSDSNRLSAENRAVIFSEHFKSEVPELESLTGLDLSKWNLPKK